MKPGQIPPSRLKRTSLAVTVVTAAILAGACAAFADPRGFQLAGGPVELTAAHGIYEWRYLDRIGDTFYDKIALHRFARGSRPPEHPSIVVLYLPGTNQNGDIALYDPRYSFPVYLATQGIDVWTLDYRTHFVPSSVTPAAISDVFKRWTGEVFESDIAAAASFVMNMTGANKIFVAGFSRGVLFSYLFAAMHPAEVAGIIALDGFIPRRPSRPAPEDHVVDDLVGKNLTWENRQFLMQSVIANPNGPAPLPKYRTAAENLERVVYDSKAFGGKGGLANPFGGYSDPVVLARMLIGYDRYWPAVQDYENPFTPELRAALKQSKIPVIAFSSTNIAPDWPAWVVESAHSTGSDDVTLRTLQGWGHLDVLCGTQARSQVFAPTVAWLRRHRM
jgi:pimeloyl-ACP methyl ester carboxylesterase